MDIRTTGVNLDPASESKLDFLSRKTGRSRSAVIRLLLFLAEVQAQPDIALRAEVLDQPAGQGVPDERAD